MITSPKELNKSKKLARCINKSNCCYGIEWKLRDEGYLEQAAHYNPPWRVQAVRNLALPGLYSRDSARFRFKYGEDLVGQALLQQTCIFVEDLQTVSHDPILADTIGASVEFSRAELAKMYDIHSVAFVPALEGKGAVIEVGSTQRYACRADLIANDVLNELLLGKEKAVPSEPFFFEPSCYDVVASVLPTTCCSLRLQRLVEGSQACYGIEWVLSDDDCLIYRTHYNPPWRIEGARKKGLKGLYTTGSEQYSFSPGEGLVGKVFYEQKPIFVENLQNCSESNAYDVKPGSSAQYLRSDLAKEYDICSALFLPVPEGVIEIGSTQQYHNAEDFVPKKLLKSARIQISVV